MSTLAAFTAGAILPRVEIFGPAPAPDAVCDFRIDVILHTPATIRGAGFSDGTVAEGVTLDQAIARARQFARPLTMDYDVTSIFVEALPPEGGVS